ncbi:hypothetical protein FACS1894133_4360 [Clostridia bacterium]|nr:hypothetical protein FACS1894133_4360 [Clostridia bacterium]
MKKALTPKTVLTLMVSPLILFFGGFAGLFKGGKILTEYKGVFGKGTAYFLCTFLMLGGFLIDAPIVILVMGLATGDLRSLIKEVVGSDIMGKDSGVLGLLVYIAILVGVFLLGLLWYSKVLKKCPDFLRSKLLTSMFMVAGGIGLKICFFMFTALAKYWAEQDYRTVVTVTDENGNTCRLFRSPNGYEEIEDYQGTMRPVTSSAKGKYNTNDGSFYQ